jgi:hypothetical protein
MTRTQSGAHWSGVPSLSQLLLAALLCLVAMLVSHAASLLRMRPSRLSGECHADATPQTLPAATSGHSGKAEPAEATSQTTEALMVSSERSSRRVYPELVEGSNHEGVLTTRAAHHPAAATLLLPRSGEAPGARTAERSRPGGGQPSRSTATPVPHRIVQASPPTHVSLPRTGEENRACVTS